MAGEWQTFSLGEVYDFSSGLSKPRSAFGSGYPFLSFKDVFYSSAVPSQLSELVQSTDQERERCSIRRGDVFLTRTSETMDELGMSCVALTDVPGATFNGFTKRLRPRRKQIAPEFARYYFRSSKFRAAVNSMSTMSTRASLNNEMLARLTISFPDYAEQEAIAHILGTLDDKIELNRRRNQILEAMARALFKDWFVDFGPVRAKLEGRAPYLPADLWQHFPGRLDDEGKPEGWVERPLGDFVDIYDSRRVPLSGKQRAERQGPYPYHGAAGVMDGVDDFLFDGVHVLLGEDGSVVKPDGRPYTQYVWGKFWVNNHAHVLRGRGITNETLLVFLDQCDVAPFVTGAVQPKLSQGNLKAIPFIDAGNALLRRFGEVVDPLFTQIRDATEESRTLAHLRDTLLPKLISGKLRIADAEKFLEGLGL